MYEVKIDSFLYGHIIKYISLEAMEMIKKVFFCV